MAFDKLEPITIGGFACAYCGKTLKKGDLHIVCPDCGGVFCEDCFNDGSFEAHTCEEED